MAYCPNCGSPAAGDAAYCTTCGQPLGPERPAAVAQAGPAPAVRPTESGLAYAGFWIRLAAWLVDSLIVLIVGGFLGGLVFVARNVSGIPRPSGTPWWLRWPRFPSSLLGFVYGWLFLSFANGRTPGMMMFGIRAAKPDGGRIDIGQAAIRQAMAIVSGLPLALGYFWMIWDPKRRTWHDMVADTRVYRT